MSSHSSHAAPSLPSTPYAGSARRRGEWDSPRRTATPRGATSSTIPPTPASSSQLVRSSEVKPSYSLLKQEILSEEEYVSHLSDIIKRDFFPHLRALDAQHEVLQAWESEDPIRIEESVRRMREICTPTPRRRAREGATPSRTPFDSASVSATPTYFDRTPMTSTPLPSSSSSSRAAAPPRVDTSLSLDAFQSRYTSHDNSSFAVLLARDNAARREKHAWAWEAEAKANARAVRGRQARERLVDVTRKMVEGSEGGTVLMLDGGPGRPGERRLLVDSSVEVGEGDRLMITGRDEKERLRITDGRDGERRDKGKDKGKEVERIDERAKQYVDWDKPTVEEEEEGKPLREEELQVETQGWPFTNRNSLMFAPDADALPHARPPQPSSAEDPSNPNPIPLGEPKGIRYHATRLMELERGSGDGEGGTPSPSRSRIGAAIAGTPYPSTSAASTTPRVASFSFVSSLPSPRASQLPPQALQELMTWGTIDATPVTLRTTGEDSSVGPFRIKDSSKREALAHKMARKAKRSLAESATGGRGLAVDARGGAAAGLRKSVLDPSSAGRASPAGSSRGPGSPRPSATDLSPAARNLLGRTKPGRALEGGLGRTKQWGDEEERRRVERAKARAREVEGRERLRRERWTPSPAVSLGFAPDLADRVP